MRCLGPHYDHGSNGVRMLRQFGVEASIGIDRMEKLGDRSKVLA